MSKRVRKLMSALAVFSLVLSAFSLVAQNKVPVSAAVPDWVKSQLPDFGARVNESEIDNGYYYLLSDIQYNEAQSAEFFHYAMKIQSDAGVQNASQVSIDFNPAYQKLIFHKIVVVRNGVQYNRLDLAKVKTLQRETSLERHIYDGTYTSVLILDDVRKGDAIEYAYSVVGSNPVFEKKLCSSFYLGFSVPLVHLYNRMLVSSANPLQIKKFNTQLEPAITKNGAITEYCWEVRNPKPLRQEDDVPKWFEPYAYISVSEYKSWNEVKTWAKSLFDIDRKPGTELLQYISSIKNKSLSDDEKLLEAIRFVQNKVRYMGIEIGEYSHRPGSADAVFKQRFGDCKDKSQLLCVILRQLGYDASPVLINTSERENLLNWLPTPTAFNHCTVLLKKGSMNFWIDPTIAYQGGDLLENNYPDFRYGLVVSDTSSNLTKIDRRPDGYMKVNEVFDIKDIGVSPVDLKVTTLYQGDEADDIRYSIANSSRKELEEQYKDFYARTYPKINWRDSLVVMDDSIRNELTTIEYYTIDDFWEKDSTKNTTKCKASFDALIVESYLKKPKAKVRKMPISLRYPSKITEDIEINLPIDWTITPENGEVVSDETAFKYAIAYRNKQVNLSYSYQIKKDFVPIEHMQKYLNAVDETNENVGFTLRHTVKNTDTEAIEENEASGNKFNWTLFSFMLFYGGVVTYIAFRVYQMKRREDFSPSLEITDPPVALPIGGWLILIAIGTVLRPLFYVIQLFSSGFFNLSRLESLSADNEHWGFIFVFESMQVVTFLIFSLLILILFFKRRDILPAAYIGFFIFSSVVSLVHEVVVHSMLSRNNSSIGTIVGIVIGAAIWIPYFSVSERVKQTFINKYEKR